MMERLAAGENITSEPEIAPPRREGEVYVAHTAIQTQTPTNVSSSAGTDLPRISSAAVQTKADKPLKDIDA